MLLRYTHAGFLVISPEDDCNAIVDVMLATNYSEDFCIATDFESRFTARLMEAGFLVMSADVAGKDEKESYYISLPKLHLERSALFFENLHIKRSVRKLLNRYELRADTDFEKIIDRCVEKHGADWLTPPLVKSIKQIRSLSRKEAEYVAETAPDYVTGTLSASTAKAYPTAFALYHNGKLAAGEFGVICGKIYTSYSGFYEEPNTGTVQIILTAKYLQEQGFLFFDLGMPMDYKNDLGAVNITPEEFVSLFRAGIKI